MTIDNMSAMKLALTSAQFFTIGFSGRKATF
jgi:hypothetical protein